MLEEINGYEENILVCEENMEKKIDWLKSEFLTIRAGRANPHMLDKILVNYYGTMTPINQMANIAVPEARMITITPWDMSQVKEVTKAIQNSDLGINPSDDGRMIRLVFPMPTEERRKELVKTVRKIAEDARIGIRNERRDTLDVFKKMEKNKEITQDEYSAIEKEVQNLTNKYVGIIDKVSNDKEKEILEI